MIMFHRNFLTSQILKWRDDGVIDAQTAQRIAANYDIDLAGANDGKSLILRLVAYLFLALSLITLISANWDEIPRAARLILVLFVLALVNLGGFFALKNGKETQATALFFLGNFCYGAAIILVAQIYHLGEHMPDGVLLWAVGALVLGAATQKSVVTLQALVLGFVWFFMEGEFSGVRHEVLVFIAVSALVLWRDSSIVLTFALFAGVYVYIYAVIAYDVYRFSSFTEWMMYGANFFFFSYCLFGICLSYLLEKFAKFDLVVYLRGICIATAITALAFDMMFYEDFGFIRYLNRQENVEISYVLAFYKSYFGVLFTALLATSLVILVWFKRYFTTAICALTLLLPFVLHAFLGYEEAVFSLVSVVVAVVLIKQGDTKFGIFLIFLVAITRYIDLVGDYVSASALFLVFSIIVLAVSRKRRGK